MSEDELSAAIAHLQNAIEKQGKPHSSAPVPIMVYEHCVVVVLEALTDARSRAQIAEERNAALAQSVRGEGSEGA